MSTSTDMDTKPQKIIGTYYTVYVREEYWLTISRRCVTSENKKPMRVVKSKYTSLKNIKIVPTCVYVYTHRESRDVHLYNTSTLNYC